MAGYGMKKVKAAKGGKKPGKGMPFAAAVAHAKSCKGGKK